MIGLIKKRMQEFKDMPRHLCYVPKNSEDPVYNMSELIELSKRYGAGFKIIGDHKKFTIISRSLVLKGLTVMILLFLAFVIWIAIGLKEPIAWIIIAVALPVFILALKFGPLLFYNITVDTYSRKITVKSNNTLGFIGKWIRPGFEVELSRLEKISSEVKKRRSSTGTGVLTVHYVNRIYLEYDQQKRPVIDFSNEINHTIFIVCLTRLIKKQ
jgi:hypothetical protein